MNDNTRDLFSRRDSGKEDLLNELDSLKELLDEPSAPAEVRATPSSNPQASTLLPPSHITTVEEYFRWKTEQAAAAQAPQEEKREATPTVEPEETESAEEVIPLLEEVVSLGEEEPSEVPELLEVVTLEAGAESAMPSGDELKALVELLVERRLNKLRDALSAEVMAELSQLYPALRGQ